VRYHRKEIYKQKKWGDKSIYVLVIAKNMIKVGVLASGRGTDLQSLIDASREKKISGKIVVVISDNKNAYALKRAQKQGIPAVFSDSGPHHEKETDQVLSDYNVDLVVGAGYMRIISQWFVKKWYGKLINIHPALLPSFKGTDGQGDALRYGVKIAGCTTHFMDEKPDHGPIILQAALPITPDDDRESLANHILEVEHQILPRTVDLFSQKRLIIKGRQVLILPGDSWKEKYPTLPNVLYSEGY
jgi:phosphoribosylglycinamide formyltransferase-1